MDYGEFSDCDPPAPLPPAPPDPPDPVISIAGSKRRLVCEDVTSAKKSTSSPDLAVASIQTVYSHPSVIVGAIQAYSPLDKGPYVVHVSRSEPELSAGTTIRPIKFGQFLSSHKIANICADGVKKVGRNKISVEFVTAVDANKFITSPILSMCKYVATIPTYNVTRMGLVRQVPTDLSMDEFADALVLPAGCGIVIKARRLNRKNVEEGKITWVPTQTVVVTFQGQLLPTKVFLYYTSLPVELYQYPTIQCHTCCRYGHTKVQCRSKPRCFRCSQEHTGDSCDIPEASASCLHCSGQHFATSKGCPEQDRQKSIKAVMSQNNISYEEAAYQFPKVSRSYSEVSQMFSQSSPSHSSQNNYSAGLSQSQAQSSRSYVKNVYASPRPRAPQGKSYDKSAHREMVSDPSSTMANGCALGFNQSLGSLPQNDNMLETLITLIINIILMNPLPLPSNVASKLTQLVSLSGQYGSSGRSPMEQPEYASKEA